MSALYYTLGNSDILIVSNEGRKEQRFPDFREKTKELFEALRPGKYDVNKNGFIFKEPIPFENRNGTILAKAIEFPIFTPLINKIFKEEGKPDKIFLFATNQRPEHPQDTWFLAHIIKKFIEKYYKIDTEIIEITCAPHDYGEMLLFFEKFVKEHEEDIRANFYNYIQVTAGTPAMCTALALNFMEYPVKYYYVDRVKKEAYRIDAFSRLNKEKYFLILKNLLEAYDYEKALTVLDNSPFRSFDKVKHLFQVLKYLRNLNFEKALEEFRYLDEEFQEKFKFLGKRCSNCREKEEERILVMYELLEIYLKNEEYIEAVAILFGILDVLRKKAVEKLFNIKIEKRNGFKEFNALCERYKDRFEKKGLRYKNNPSGPVLNELIVYKLEETKSGEAKKLLEFAKLVEKEELLELRNLGPFAHGTKGIPDDCKNALLKAKDKLKEILVKEEAKNIFDKVNEEVKAILQPQIYQIPLSF